MTTENSKVQNAQSSDATRFRADAAAIGLSIACLAHCLLIPVVLTLAPALTVGVLGDEQFHRWLLVAILPTSTLALLLGCWRHRSAGVIITGIAGLLLLLVAGFLGHEQLGETGEKAITSIGAVIVACSHIMNHRLCRRAPCEC